MYPLYRCHTCVCIAASLVVGLAYAQQPTFRVGTTTVVVYATAQSQDGRLILDLDRDEFEILDNGHPVEITHFSSDIQPITAVLMLDMSASMASRLALVRDAADHFIDALQPQDRIRIGSFAWPEVAISPWLTNEKALLRRIVREETWPDGFTALWNAVNEAMTSLRPETGRRVVLVLSDGADSGDRIRGNVGQPAVRQRAVADAFTIYAVRFPLENTSVSSFSAEDRQLDLADLTWQTGGGHFLLEDDADLASTFRIVAEELRRQYVLGFTPSMLDGTERSLDVRVTRPGAQIRARRSYIAMAQR